MSGITGGRVVRTPVTPRRGPGIPGLRSRPHSALSGVAVLGSANVDLVAVTARRPAWGESATGEGFYTAVGGKGLNQAVAAAKAGGDVGLVVAVGTDAYADLIVEELEGSGVELMRRCAGSKAPPESHTSPSGPTAGTRSSSCPARTGP